jgi:hypothetical protein
MGYTVTGLENALSYGDLAHERRRSSGFGVSRWKSSKNTLSEW